MPDTFASEHTSYWVCAKAAEACTVQFWHRVRKRPMRAIVFSYFYESCPISVCYSQILDQLITKFTLTRLCQLSSRVGGSFVLRFFFLYLFIFLLHYCRESILPLSNFFDMSALDHQKRFFFTNIQYSLTYQYNDFIETGSDPLYMYYSKSSFINWHY